MQNKVHLLSNKEQHHGQSSSIKNRITGLGYIRGYHAYMEVWTPSIVEVLVVKPEPTNNQSNGNTVAVLKINETVGHVSRNLAPRLFLFLRRDLNKAFAEVTDRK